MADGRELQVAHPEMLAYTGGGRTIFVGLAGEDFEIIDVLLVTSIEVSDRSRRRRRR